MSTENTIDAVVNLVRDVQTDAQAAGMNWADVVDDALRGAGYIALDPVAYGAEQDTRLVAVIQIDGRAVGIWGHDDGTWTSGPATPVNGEHQVYCWRFQLCDGESEPTYQIADSPFGPMDDDKGRRLRNNESFTRLAGASNSPLAYEGSCFLSQDRIDELREAGRFEDADKDEDA